MEVACAGSSADCFSSFRQSQQRRVHQAHGKPSQGKGGICFGNCAGVTYSNRVGFAGRPGLHHQLFRSELTAGAARARVAEVLEMNLKTGRAGSRAVLLISSALVVVAPLVCAQGVSDAPDLAIYRRIREEGVLRSQVMDLATELVDGIGPRLTGSANLARAVAWSQDRLRKMGLSNVHTDSWGEFGLGWQQRNVWLRMVEPDTAPFIVHAAPWSPPTPGPITADVVYVRGFSDEKEFEPHRGKLRDKIVLLGAPWGCRRPFRSTRRCPTDSMTTSSRISRRLPANPRTIRTSTRCSRRSNASNGAVGCWPPKAFVPSSSPAATTPAAAHPAARCMSTSTPSAGCSRIGRRVRSRCHLRSSRSSTMAA